ncbi:hypothetical protein [Lysinibacillus odysseyi]|uniref:DnaD domain-containing protein n=1 Tax=Lysinibacillus odysseyi 34hs-1 = NBRC 100172 TaxID=1220589 RepID=A0A0A3INB2_9BACI|nr:hypothetical protein [Lysinibacillus odysseyi]KGR84288.1 hypothetical protein CD32_11860 [Lysinibacillus odysseyi 34hs-1 = NBRC 100172]
MRKLANCESVPVYKRLAVKIGLYEAIFIQQLHYRLQFSKTVMAGDKWYQCKMDNWLLQLPFLSKSTIERTIRSLCIMQLVERRTFNGKGTCYRICYEVLQKVLVVDSASTRSALPSDGNYASNCCTTAHQVEGESTSYRRRKIAKNADISTAAEPLRSKERIKEKIIKESNDVLLYAKAIGGQWGEDEGRVFQTVYDALNDGADVVNMLTQVRQACQQQLTLYPDELFGNGYA